MKMMQALIAPLSLLAVLAVEAAPATAQTFSETTDVVAVEVPVQVMRDGEPVRGLTAADFEVWDGRRKQTLTGFEVVDLGEADAAALSSSELPESAQRRFLILFDLTFSSLKGLTQARKAVLEMVESLHPTDLVAVGSWSNRRGAQIVQNFTSDPGLITAALESLGPSELMDNLPPDPLRMAAAEGKGARPPVAGRESRLGLTRDVAEEEADEILATVARLSEEARLLEISLAVEDLSRSLTGFAEAMRTVQGRKQVVWFSEGFEPAALSTGPHGTRTLNAVERMLEELRRADCTVQVVDIAGLRALGNLARGEVLLNFAKGTGGELYEKTNDLGGAMRQMLRRTGVTYVLTFQAENPGKPGSLHRLRVKVKDQPRGTRVVHRPAWFAPEPYPKEMQ